MTDVKYICNTLAEQFSFNSLSDNYSHRFNRYRLTIERTTNDVDTNNHYLYNDRCIYAARAEASNQNIT